MSWFKPLAYALILLGRAGYPCVFFGDLYGRLDPHGSGPSCSGHLSTLILARKLFAYGPQDSYFDTKDCIGFVRRGTQTRPSGLACVLSNARSKRKKKMFVGRQHSGETWADLIGGSADVKIDGSGWGAFECEQRSASVFVSTVANGKERFPLDFDSRFYR
jgi:alpha-amylase